MERKQANLPNRSILNCFVLFLLKINYIDLKAHDRKVIRWFKNLEKSFKLQNIGFCTELWGKHCISSFSNLFTVLMYLLKGFLGFFCCVFLFNLSLLKRWDWYHLGKKFWGPHSKIVLTSPGITPLLSHAACLTPYSYWNGQKLRQVSKSSGWGYSFISSQSPNRNQTHSRLHCSSWAGSAPLPLWASTISPIYLDALEVDGRFFGLGWCRCRCRCWCRRWCCGCCWFLYVLLWCHFVLLKLASKSALKKSFKQTSTNKNHLISDSWERSSGQNELQPVPWRNELQPGPNVLNPVRAYIYFT